MRMSRNTPTRAPVSAASGDGSATGGPEPGAGSVPGVDRLVGVHVLDVALRHLPQRLDQRDALLALAESAAE